MELIMKKISIEYCTGWGYLARAVSLTDELLNEHANKIKKLSLIPSTGGVFEVSVDKELIFSKKELKRFPEEGEVEQLVRDLITT